MSNEIRQDMQELLDQIVDAIKELDSYYEDEPTLVQTSPPATESELAALERHWGRILPPSYRCALSIYNGFSKVWAEVPLLSTSEITENYKDTITFKEPFPSFWRFIIACDNESYDALCFDTATTQRDGEMNVVQLSDEGEGERWRNFEEFLKDRLVKLRDEISAEKADRESLNE